MKRARSDSTDSEPSSEPNVPGQDIFQDDDIEDILQELPDSIPRDKALAFLHTLASSKTILYWNSYGEMPMMYHGRRIPVTSVAELIEYTILPYNLDVRTPRGLKTFTQGLSEIGIDKRLIRNKKVLADLVARQPEENDNDDDSEVSGSETHDEDKI